MSDQYPPDAIPKKFDTIIYTHYCYHSDYNWHIGKVSHDTSDRSGDNYICIAKTPLTIFVTDQKMDLKKMVIDALEAEKKKQMAEYHKKMFELQEKIDNLLCLTYQPGDSMDVDTVNDLPF